MKKRIVSITLLTCGLLCKPSVIQAQASVRALTSQAPILPMNVKFRYVPQYFVQSVEDDPRYARIEALVDEGRCEVVLLDKTMNRKTFYSTLSRKVDALKANGADAYATPIDCEAFTVLPSSDRLPSLEPPRQPLTQPANNVSGIAYLPPSVPTLAAESGVAVTLLLHPSPARCQRSSLGRDCTLAGLRSEILARNQGNFLSATEEDGPDAGSDGKFKQEATRTRGVSDRTEEGLLLSLTVMARLHAGVQKM
jgi:hypothetical protein